MAAFVMTGGVVQRAHRVVAGLSRSVRVQALEGIVLLLARVANAGDQAQRIRQAVHGVSESGLALRRNRVATGKQRFRGRARCIDGAWVQHLQAAEVGELVVVVATKSPVEPLERGTVQADFFRELTL